MFKRSVPVVYNSTVRYVPAVVAVAVVVGGLAVISAAAAAAAESIQRDRAIRQKLKPTAAAEDTTAICNDTTTIKYEVEWILVFHHAVQ